MRNSFIKLGYYPSDINVYFTLDMRRQLSVTWHNDAPLMVVPDDALSSLCSGSKSDCDNSIVPEMDRYGRRDLLKRS